LLLEYGWPDNFERDAYLAEYADNMQLLEDDARHAPPKDPAVERAERAAYELVDFTVDYQRMRLQSLAKSDAEEAAAKASSGELGNVVASEPTAIRPGEDAVIMQYLTSEQKEMYLMARADIEERGLDNQLWSGPMEMADQEADIDTQQAVSDPARDELPQSGPAATPSNKFDQLLEMLREDPVATAKEEGFFMQYLSLEQKERYVRSKDEIRAHKAAAQEQDIDMGEQVSENETLGASNDTEREDLSHSATAPPRLFAELLQILGDDPAAGRIKNDVFIWAWLTPEQRERYLRNKASTDEQGLAENEAIQEAFLLQHFTSEQKERYFRIKSEIMGQEATAPASQFDRLVQMLPDDEYTAAGWVRREAYLIFHLDPEPRERYLRNKVNTTEQGRAENDAIKEEFLMQNLAPKVKEQYLHNKSELQAQEAAEKAARNGVDRLKVSE
jgi:hypothetical protein